MKIFTCVINDAKKMQIFSVRVRWFIHLNDLYVLKDSDMKDT